MAARAELRAEVRAEVIDDTGRVAPGDSGLLVDALHGEIRLLPGRFMVIQQAMGLARSRGEAA